MHLEDAFIQNWIHLDTNQCDGIHGDIMMLCVLRFIMDSSVLILPLDEDGPLQTLSVFLWLFSALNRISVFGDCLWWNEALQQVWSHFILADLTSSLILGWSFIAQETKRQNETAFYYPYKNLSSLRLLRFLLKLKRRHEVIRVFTPLLKHHLHDNL